MKALLDINDNKAQFVLELLHNLSSVKTKTLTPYIAKILEDVKEAVDEMNLIKAGKLKARNADELYYRLP